MCREPRIPYVQLSTICYLLSAKIGIARIKCIQLLSSPGSLSYLERRDLPIGSRNKHVGV